MDTLIGKLTNLSYELFGIIIPGAAATGTLMLFWAVSGDANVFSVLHLSPSISASQFTNAISFMLDWSIFLTLIIALALFYLLGHLITWIGRGGRSYDEIRVGILLRDTLIFLPPKPRQPYAAHFEPLQRIAAKHILPKDLEYSWSIFYIPAKVYLMKSSLRSSITTYQNKYTMHRALSVVSAVSVWLCATSFIIGLISLITEFNAYPHWPRLAFLLLFSLVAVWGFSSSYIFNWRLWGNYLVSETYISLTREDIKCK